MNHGYKKDKYSEQDYILGGGMVPFEILCEDGDWTQDLPEEEAQNLNRIEPYACVPFTIFNAIETVIFRKYGIRTNYSDRFFAALVNTKNGGTSYKQAFDYLRKVGAVPQDLWPFDASIDSTEDFFAPIPPKLFEAARDFLNEWEVKYERVPGNSFSKALMTSPLLVSVYAWNEGENNLYTKPEGMADNHATLLVYERLEGFPGRPAFRRVFDSYGPPFIKDYALTEHDVAYRIHVRRLTPSNAYKDIGERVREFFAWGLSALKNLIK